jgi:chloramphenicol 3-O-phosphotransferase
MALGHAELRAHLLLIELKSLLDDRAILCHVVLRLHVRHIICEREEGGDEKRRRGRRQGGWEAGEREAKEATIGGHGIEVVVERVEGRNK